MHDEDDSFPIDFHDALGDNAMNTCMKEAIVYATLVKFSKGTDLEFDPQVLESIKLIDFASKKLSKAVVFHGPFEEFEETIKDAVKRGGVVIAPKHLWTDEKQEIWIACISN
jgi:hypothetical protein